jgi:hypothetical protein
MRKALLVLFILIFSSSCGSLKVSPKGCKTQGHWGETSEEIKVSEEFYVWNADNEVKLRDFLKKKGIECSDVKKVRVEIKSVFFVSRELSVFVSK